MFGKDSWSKLLNICRRNQVLWLALILKLRAWQIRPGCKAAPDACGGWMLAAITFIHIFFQTMNEKTIKHALKIPELDSLKVAPRGGPPQE